MQRPKHTDLPSHKIYCCWKRADFLFFSFFIIHLFFSFDETKTIFTWPNSMDLVGMVKMVTSDITDRDLKFGRLLHNGEDQINSKCPV